MHDKAIQLIERRINTLREVIASQKKVNALAQTPSQLKAAEWYENNALPKEQAELAELEASVLALRTAEPVFIPQGAEGSCPKCGSTKPVYCMCA